MMDITSQKGENPFDEPTRKLRASDPEEVARKAGALWRGSAHGKGVLVLPVLSGEVSVSYPDIEVDAPPPLGSFSMKLLSLLYLANTDGTPPSGEWTAYRDLPGGRFYEPVVRRSVDEPLLEAYGSDPEGFRKACALWGGEPAAFGDAACSFALFPKVLVTFILWRGDEEFPARAAVLFDSNSSRHMSAFDLRMGAQEISSRLIKARGGEGS
jgi:hypothetical protein